MSERWFYLRQGQEQGPVSAQELRFLVKSGQVGDGDVAWPEHGVPRRIAEFPALCAEAGSPSDKPDWLDDVRRAESLPSADSGLAPLSPPPANPLAWLQDVERPSKGEEPRAAGPPAGPPPLPWNLPPSQVPSAARREPVEEPPKESPVWTWVLLVLAGLVLTAAVLVGIAVGW